MCSTWLKTKLTGIIWKPTLRHSCWLRWPSEPHNCNTGGDAWKAGWPFLFSLHTHGRKWKPSRKRSAYRPGNHWKLNWSFWKMKDHWDCTSQKKHKRPENKRREEGSRETGGRMVDQSGKGQWCGRYLGETLGSTPVTTCIYPQITLNLKGSCSKLDHCGDSCSHI